MVLYLCICVVYNIILTDGELDKSTPRLQKPVAWLHSTKTCVKTHSHVFIFEIKIHFCGLPLFLIEMLASPSLTVPCTHSTLAVVIILHDYSMHNVDDYTLLHLLLIKNKYVTLPLLAPSKILTTISYLKKKYKRRNREAVSPTSHSRQTAHWKCNTLLLCHRSAGKWQSEF